MKSILFYFNSLQPSGGIERVISTLANKFSDSYEITILVKNEAISYYPLNDGIKLISLDNNLDFNMNSKISRVFSAFKSLLSSSKLLKKYLAKNTFDYYYLAHPLNVLEFHLAEGVSNENTIITEHGGVDAYNFVYKGIKKWLYKRAKVYVVPTITDTAIYKNARLPAEYIPHFRSSLPYEKVNLESKVALTVGRFTHAKRQWDLIDLWQRLVYKHNISDWKLHIVGSGDLHEELSNKIKQAKLEMYVSLKPPLVAIERYYLESSLFLLTSFSEGFGMVLLEAISFGIPCVSYDCPAGPRDIIKNNFNGFLVENGNLDKLEEKVLLLIKDKDALKEKGNNAYTSSNDWEDDAIKQKWINNLT